MKHAERTVPSCSRGRLSARPVRSGRHRHAEHLEIPKDYSRLCYFQHQLLKAGQTINHDQVDLGARVLTQINASATLESNSLSNFLRLLRVNELPSTKPFPPSDKAWNAT